MHKYAYLEASCCSEHTFGMAPNMTKYARKDRRLPI